MLLPALEEDALTVFLFGPGTRESVVVHAPGDGWLVVDGCTAGGTIYPLALLQHYAARPTAIVLTHPHLDHARGLARLVEEFTKGPTEEWPRLAMVPAPDTRGVGDLWDPKAALDGGIAEQAIATILDRWGRSGACRWPMDLGHSHPVGEAVVRVVSPVDKERDAAANAWRAQKKHDYNRAATALLVTWKGRRVLLGADLVEEPGKGWSSAMCQDAALTDHDLYKIAHHGAVRAIGPQTGKPSSAMVRKWIATPFASQGLPRPNDGEGLSQLARHRR